MSDEYEKVPCLCCEGFGYHENSHDDPPDCAGEDDVRWDAFDQVWECGECEGDGTVLDV